MIRLLIYAALAYIIYRWWRSKSRQKKITRTEHYKPSLEGAELVQDPNCGVYFLKDRAIKVDIEEKTYYFCSETCRDEFLAEHRAYK